MTKARDIADSELGSLTVDTDTLVVDETNNRVGIGAISPSQALDVNGTSNATNLTRGGSQVYSRDNILGTVSESSGVPTGAVIERGGNANGDFVKYADGTVICTRLIEHDFSSAGNTGNYDFPVAFASNMNTQAAGAAFRLTNIDARHDAFASYIVMAKDNLGWRVVNTVAGLNETLAVRLFVISRWY